VEGVRSALGQIVARAALHRGLRVPLRMSLDGLAWLVGLVLATLLRYDITGVPDGIWGSVAAVVGIAFVVQAALGFCFGLYRGRFTIASFEELRGLLASMGLTTALLVAVDIAVDRPVPGSVAFIGGALALLLAAGGRYTWRAVADHALRPRGEGVSRLIVFGAGETGTQVARLMLRNPQSQYLPVAFLDDDPRKRHLQLHGVPVRGTRADLAQVAEREGATMLLLAAPSAPIEVQRAVGREARALGLGVRSLPSLDELIGDRVTLNHIRPLVDAELLGRPPIQIDLDAVAQALTGKRVLVTGAGGSIGAEICRQVAALEPAELVMLDRDESALHFTQLSIRGHGLLDTPDLVLADIRDRARVDDVFRRWQPDVVFHAAALKHLPLLELHPDEAVKTNLGGTMNVLEASLACGIERFVNVSTDKAANPISVLGYTKRIAERLTAWFGKRSADGVYVSVRFGNVLGSRGSLLTAFQHQIASGGPVTVTHEEVTRYFMTLSEAVQLVLQSTVAGATGEALVFDMGSPVSILQIAQQLAAEAEGDIEIKFTGLRPGEKLHEELLGVGERDGWRPHHPLISQVDVPPLPPSALQLLSGLTDAGSLREGMRTLARLDVPYRWAADPDIAGSIGYVIVAADGRIEAMNALASEYLFGAHAALDTIERDNVVWDAVGADGQPLDPRTNPVVTAMREGAPERVVIGLRHGSDAARWVECSTHPLTDRDDSTVALLCLLQPVDSPISDPARAAVSERAS
jgi:FlaA1/EpsC-like NDP-sugar epimerase